MIILIVVLIRIIAVLTTSRSYKLHCYYTTMIHITTLTTTVETTTAAASHWTTLLILIITIWSKYLICRHVRHFHSWQNFYIYSRAAVRSWGFCAAAEGEIWKLKQLWTGPVFFPSSCQRWHRGQVSESVKCMRTWCLLSLWKVNVDHIVHLLRV